MKITIVSLTFLPKIGGLENIMAGLALEWHKLKHEVSVYTDISQIESTSLPYEVVREFSLIQLFKAVTTSDILIEANISLKTAIIGLLFRKKWFVSHHIHYSHDKSWKGKLKNYLTNYPNNIACSRYIASTLKGKAITIQNFYDPLFQRLNHLGRQTNSIVFVGRLVSDKGGSILIEAINKLNQESIQLTCTIIGDGPEKLLLKESVAKYKLENVHFAGILKGNQLVEALNKHAIMVIPSTWDEPFGIVALEGLACGCLVVASNKGGLPEAVNGHGILYSDNDPNKLAEAFKKAFDYCNLYKEKYHSVDSFLQTRTSVKVAQAYLDYFQSKCS